MGHEDDGKLRAREATAPVVSSPCRGAVGGQEFAIDSGDPSSYQAEPLPMIDENER